MKGEKGQALPLAMMALAIGMIVITPFLWHASASVIGSRTYGDSIKNSSACDAGVEHAIWRLTRDGLAEKLQKPGEYVNYQLGETINNLNTVVTVTANVSGSVRGDVADLILDSFEFDTSNCYTPDIVRVSYGVYAISYRGPGNDGFLKTVSIDADGHIAKLVIDTLEFDTSDGYEPDIIHISGDVYAIAYRGSGNDGFLKTVSISSNGNIGNAVIDTLEFDNSNCYEPCVVGVSEHIYAIAYRGTDNDGFLKTVSVDVNGEIGDSVIDTLEFDISNCYTPDMIKISDNRYAIAYRGVDNDGFLKTVAIDIKGDIGNSVIDTLEFDTSNGYEPCIISVQENIYAVAYRGTNNDGFLKTVSISATGDIGNAVIDVLEFDTLDGYEPCIINVWKDTFAVAYRGTGSDGYLKTLTIASDGDIGASVIDALEFDTSNGQEPRIINVSNEIFVIAYRGAGSDGFMTTVEIGRGSAPTFEIMASAGGLSISACVSVSGENATIESWRIQ